MIGVSHRALQTQLSSQNCSSLCGRALLQIVSDCFADIFAHSINVSHPAFHPNRQAKGEDTVKRPNSMIRHAHTLPIPAWSGHNANVFPKIRKLRHQTALALFIHAHHSLAPHRQSSITTQFRPPEAASVKRAMNTCLSTATPFS